MRGRAGGRVLAAAGFAITVTFSAAAAGAQEAVAIALRAAEEQLAAALVAKDAGTLERLLAPGFVMRGAPDITRGEWIANALKLCWGERADISDFRVVDATADPALVTFVLTTGRDPVSCERATVRSLITDVWERRDGAWQLVLRHSGPAGGVAAQFAAEAAPPPLLEGSAELSLVDTGGNADTQTVGSGGSLIWRPGVWTTDARVSFVRSMAGGVETAKTFTAGVRQSRALSPRLDVFARAEHLANEFAGIDNRVSLDAGLGYRWLEGPAHTLRTDAGAGYSRETRLSGDDLSFALATAGAAYQWTVTSALTLADTTLFTASLQDGEDWRFRNMFSITSSLARRLSIKVSHEINVANAPAPGFGRTDTVLSAALVLGLASAR